MFISGCASIAPTRASRAYWEKQFGILVRNTPSVDGNKITNNLLIYKKSDGFGGVQCLLAGKILPEENAMNTLKEKGYTGEYIYFFDVLYQDPRTWAFIDSLDFKTDTSTVKLKDKNPTRDVIRIGNDSFVHEFARFIITPEEINNILKTNSLIVQYKGEKSYFDILTFKGDDLQKIKDFITADILTEPSKNW